MVKLFPTIYRKIDCDIDPYFLVLSDLCLTALLGVGIGLIYSNGNVGIYVLTSTLAVAFTAWKMYVWVQILEERL